VIPSTSIPGQTALPSAIQQAWRDNSDHLPASLPVADFHARQCQHLYHMAMRKLATPVQKDLFTDDG